MAETVDHVATANWQEVAQGNANVTIQPHGKTTFQLHVTTAEGTPAEDAPALVVSTARRNLPSEFEGFGLPAGTKVWLRQFQDRAAAVTIVRY